MTTENDNATDTTQTTTAAAEPSMAEYATQRENEMRGVTAEKAEATDASKSAAATDDKSAAATPGDDAEGKTTTASAPVEDAEIEALEAVHPAKKGIQKRFSEMTAKQKELQAAADAAKAEADEAKAELQRVREEANKRAADAIPKVLNAEDDQMPSRADYDDPDEFVAALSAHTSRAEIRKANEAALAAIQERETELQAAQEAQQQAQVQAQIAQLHQTFHARVAEAKPDMPDYAEKVENNTELVLRNNVFFAIEQAKDAPYILYHLANNPEIAAELNGLSQIEVAMRLGEMQSELRIARKPRVTKAADPIKPVGSRQNEQRKSPNDESMEEYGARREREMKSESSSKSKGNLIRKN